MKSLIFFAAATVSLIAVSAAAPTPVPAADDAAQQKQKAGGATEWWKPQLTDTWQWQLNGTINTGYKVKVYDVDLFDTPDATIKKLQDAKIKVVCYFSAGSYEKWRDKAYNGFVAADKGKKMDGWDEQWLDIRSANVRKVMGLRLDLAKKRKCDAVEPDNVDGYTNDTGFPLTAEHQLAFNRFLATEAHRRGLGVGLKNDVDQAEDLARDFDFAVNEQCHEYGTGNDSECDLLAPFVELKKPVFNAEYASKYRKNTGKARDKLCADSKKRDFRTLILPLDLDDTYRFSCDAV